MDAARNYTTPQTKHYLKQYQEAASQIQRLFRGFSVRNQAENRATCGICLEEDRKTKLSQICPVIQETKSGGHRFHRSCAIEYFSTVLEPKCPLCQVDLTFLVGVEPALSELGSRYTNYVEPVMTPQAAYENYREHILHLPLNPTAEQRQAVSQSFQLWQLLSLNVSSMA